MSLRKINGEPKNADNHFAVFSEALRGTPPKNRQHNLYDRCAGLRGAWLACMAHLHARR